MTGAPTTGTSPEKIRLARALMDAFAEETGVRGPASPRRYLWTDAFAVCGFLELERHVGHGGYRALALALIDQVHHVLGRHRPDDPRSGWISGLSEQEGERHPTIGGLRIGKPLGERRTTEPFDPRLEWDRDGQYFHYLTRWMHALRVAGRETGDERYLDWAVELARTAHRSFSVDGGRRMVWKMNIDLSRPVVESMGHHDPLDGLITALELDAAVGRTGAGNGGELQPAIAGFDAMCRSRQWATTDALGIGGLLDATARLGQLVSAGQRCADRGALMATLLDESRVSLRAFSRMDVLDDPAESRLAFRDLGLSIGLHAIEKASSLSNLDSRIADALRTLVKYRPVAERIETFWSNAGNRRPRSWTEHADINAVMLATSLAPHTYVCV